MPTPGNGVDDVEKAIHEEIERMRKEPVGDAELEKFKTRARASMIRGLSSNMGMAQTLAKFQDISGDWRNLFRQYERIQQISAEDIQRVATEYLVPRNRTTIKLVTQETDAPSE